MTTFKKENNDILKFILDKRFFEPWRNERETGVWEDDAKKLINDTNLEIYLTTQCNQNCEYCYLIKNKNKLYPQEFDKKEIILKNLDILYNWIIENNFYIPNVDLYSGEIWHTDFGLEVLDKTYDALTRGMQIGHFTIPANCTFLRSTKYRDLIQRRINKFKKIGTPIQFSISVDGKIIEDLSRPTNNKYDIKDDEFYEQMFMFAKYNDFYFHPMVSSFNVKYWIENYKWWKENIQKYNLPPEALMMLEVRNDDWTEESINDYNNFMNFLLEDFVNDYGAEYLGDLLLRSVYANNFKDFTPSGYFPFLVFDTEDYQAGCSIPNHLTIRAGDLAICPCHRTAYDKYLYGKFIVENDKIVGIDANNTQAAIRILLCNNRLCSFKCDTCIFNAHCLQGCYGAQLEANNDPFIPIESVCQFFESKYVNLLRKYVEYGIIDFLERKKPHEVDYIAAKKYLNFVNEVDKRYGLGKNK